MPTKKEVVRAFIELDCKKFAGLMQVYIRMLEKQIPFVTNADRAQGMADAVALLQGAVNKAEEVAEMVKQGRYKELENIMAVEGLPPYLKQKAN